MYTRFLTYDLKYADTENYQELYELIKQYKYEKITESTWKIETKEDFATFKTKFQKVTKSGDNIKVIIKTDNGMEVRSIR